MPKTEVLREDIKDAVSKDKDTKDESDVFLMRLPAYYIFSTFLQDIDKDYSFEFPERRRLVEQE